MRLHLKRKRGREGMGAERKKVKKEVGERRRKERDNEQWAYLSNKCICHVLLLYWS